jgi:DNA-binding IclR family transcriptional regulator
LSRDTTVNVIGRVQSILEPFAQDGRARGLNELVRATALPKATVFRLASDLSAIGLLTQSADDKRYRLGALAARLGRFAVAARDLRALASPLLQELAALTGETILLSTLDETRKQVVCVEQIVSRHGLRIVSEVGKRLPLHAGGASKAIFAFMSAAEIEHALARKLEKVARRTKTDADALRAELARIRRQGYAPSVDETLDGAAGFGVPVFDHDGSAAASIAVVGPSARMSDRGERWLPAARRAADALSRQLGGEPANDSTTPRARSRR